MGLFNRKKIDRASKEVKDDNYEEANIPVYFADEEIGRVVKMVGKEVAGLEMFNMWIMTNKGAAIDSRILQIIKKQGIYLGKPIEKEE